MKLSREEVLEHLRNGDGTRNLSGSDLAGVDLSRLDLRGVDLSRADLSAADLRWAILEGADLHSSVLRRADCRWAVLRGANLRHADLGLANLGWADVAGADLTGAQFDGTSFENVDLATTKVGAAPQARERAVGASQIGGLALPQSRVAIAAITLLTGSALTQLWGWLYRRAFFGAFNIDDSAVTSLTHSDNFASGLGVLLLTLKALLASPLVVASVGAALALALAVPVIFVLFGDRVITDIVRPQLRTPVIGALFLLYFVLFYIVFVPALMSAGAWLFEHALPGEDGLRSIFIVAATGGALAKAGFVLLLGAFVYLLWIGWRALSYAIHHRDLRASWRLRYPRLNAVHMAARGNRLFQRSEPLATAERRRAIAAAAAAAFLLPTLLSGVGRVEAFHSMCDGGELPRVQLFSNRAPAAAPEASEICARQLARTDDTIYVFFPSETERVVRSDEVVIESVEETLEDEAEAPSLTGGRTEIIDPTPAPPDDPREVEHRAVVYSVNRGEVVKEVVALDTTTDCATCLEGPSGEERALIDPDEVVVGGIIGSRTGNLFTVNQPIGALSAFAIDDATRIVRGNTAAEADQLVVGAPVRAYGSLSESGDYVDARRVVILREGGTSYNATLTVELDPAGAQVTLIGAGWVPGSRVAVGLAEVGVGAPRIPIGTGEIQVDEQGGFNAPIVVDSSVPTTGHEVVVRALDGSDLVATGAWFTVPLPTPVPTPTPPPPPTEPPFPTDSAEEPGTPEATNTAFPTQVVPGGPVAGACEPDEYEFDGGRGFQKEIYVGFAEGGAVQQRNFCPRGDKDLAFFRVKAGRWYRVFTQNLAPGVDTVLAVGDLSVNTPCQPAGCWNDDRAPLTYASEVILQAVEDATALITVDNFGTAYGSDATYELGVVEFIPEPTPTVTPPPSPTATATPTVTPTPKPFIDRGDEGLGNNTCGTAHPLVDFSPFQGTIHRSTDIDWFRTMPLGVGDYRVTLVPPRGLDYDLQVYDGCPGTLFASSRESGDREEEIIVPVIVSGTAIYIRVFPADANQVDVHRPYILQLSPIGDAAPAPTPTATMPPPPPVPTPTASPTLALPVP